jgi:hypothetical protein
MSGGIGHGDDIRTEELETSEGSAFAESLELPVEDSPEPTTSFAAEIQYSDSLAEMANEPQFQSADQAPAAVAPSAAAPAAPVSSSPSAVTTGALLADLESRLAPQIEAKVNAILAEALPRIVEDTVVRAIERALADLRKRLG